MLLELLIEHNCLIRVRYMAAKSHQGRPQSPFAKGGSNRIDRTLSTCAARLLTLVVGWVEREKNGGVRCFNLILHTSHNMQLCEISETHRIMTAQPTLRHDKFHWVTSNRTVRKIWRQKWPV